MRLLSLPVMRPKLREDPNQIWTCRRYLVVNPWAAGKPRGSSFLRRRETYESNEIPNVSVKNLFIGGVSRVSSVTFLVCMGDTEILDVSDNSARYILFSSCRADERGNALFNSSVAFW
jgi:hypothetical protein